MHVKQVFYSSDLKERGWKVVLHKDPCGRQVNGGVEFDPMDLHMFRIDNDDEYTWLQAPASIPEALQVANIVVGNVTLTTRDLVDDVIRGEDSCPHSLDEYVGSSTFESDG